MGSVGAEFMRGGRRGASAGGWRRGDDAGASITDEGGDLVVAEARAAVEEAELDDEGEAGHGALLAFDQPGAGAGGAAGGEQVVDDDAATAGHGVLVDLEGVGAVFEGVAFAGGFPRELAGLADGGEADAEAVGEGGAEEETAR